MLQRVGIEPFRLFRFVERVRQATVDFADAECRLGQYLGNTVVGGLAIGCERFLHARLLEFQAVFERRLQRDRKEGFADRLRQAQGRARGERARTIAALRTGASIERDQALQAVDTRGLVAALRGEIDQALCRVQRFVERVRIALDIQREYPRFFDIVAMCCGLLRGLQQRLLTFGHRRLRRVRDAFEFGRRRRIVLLCVGQREAGGDRVHQRARRVLAPERLQHRHCGGGIAGGEVSLRGVVVGGGANLCVGCSLADAQKRGRSLLRIAGRARRLTLTVNRRRDALGQLRVAASASDIEFPGFEIGALGAGEVLRIETRMADHQPGDATLRDIGCGGCRFRRSNRLAQRAGRKQTFGGVDTRGCRVLIVREAFGEVQFGVDQAPVPCRLRLGVQTRLVALVGEQRGVTGFGAVGVRGILVRGRFVGRDGCRIVAAFEQYFAEQELAVRRLRVVRKIGQITAVAIGCKAVLAVALGARRVLGLRQRVMMLCEDLHGFAQECDDRLVRRARLLFPERLIEAEAAHEALARRQNFRRELALVEARDRLHVQIRRSRMQRLGVDEAGQHTGRVGVALLFEILRGEAQIEQVAVLGIMVLVQRPTQGLFAFEIRERQRHDAQRVVDQLARRARETIDVAIDIGRRNVRQTRVEQAQERGQARLVAVLLEQRPAVLVQRLFVERRLGIERQHGRVGALGRLIALAREQDFATPELHFVEQRRLRKTRNQLVQRRQRRERIATAFLRPRQLVEHQIVARKIRVFGEQTAIQGDGLGIGRGAKLVAAALQFVGFAGFEFEIAETTQGLGGAFRIGAGKLEKLAVVFARQTFGIGDRRVWRQIDCAAGEIAKRLARSLVLRTVGCHRRPQADAGQQRADRTKPGHGPGADFGTGGWSAARS